MKLRIVQFNYGFGGISSGSVSAHLYGPPPASALDQSPYMDICVGFTVHREAPEFNPENHEVVILPSNLFLRAGFIWELPVNVAKDQPVVWPRPNEYRNKLTRMIANMITTAELDSLQASVPTLIP